MDTLPERVRTYQNHHLDSTRWEAFRPRPDDIVIATSMKSGTTWTQAIVANLLFADQAFPEPPWRMSPWLDLRPPPLDEMIAMLDAQEHRRFIKTHLPLDALPYSPELKYIFIGRDGRDVAMSLWNHYRHYTEDAFARYNTPEGRIGDELPRPPESLDVFWRDWCTKGWFDWERDGWPFWSHLTVVESWWRFRALPNILVLHYADMTRDPAESIRRIADFLEIDLGPKRLAQVVEATSLATMRRQGESYVPGAGRSFKNGADTFLHKGTNRQWEGVISAEGLALYDAAATRVLCDDCRGWLEHGEAG